MPGLVRKLLIFAAVDGLILQPLTPKGQRPAPPVKVAYNGAAIGPALADGAVPAKSFEAFGIVGMCSFYGTEVHVVENADVTATYRSLDCFKNFLSHFDHSAAAGCTDSWKADIRCDGGSLDASLVEERGRDCDSNNTCWTTKEGYRWTCHG